MKARRHIALGMMAWARVLASPADFWAVRAPEKWSEPEIIQMVTGSPWAKQAAVFAKGGEITAGRRVPQPEIGDDQRTGRLPPGLDPNSNPGATSSPSILVRWESAASVCDACSNGSIERALFSCYSKLLYLSGLSEKWAELAKNYYVLSMSNYPKTALSGRDLEAPEHSAGANNALERFGERVQRATFLKCKHKSPLSPARVLVLPAGRALLVVVLFPRSDVIALDDKEVAFESVGPNLEVRAKFNLRKMIYKGTLDL